jgi:rhomboid protease GluP
MHDSTFYKFRRLFVPFVAVAVAASMVGMAIDGLVEIAGWLPLDLDIARYWLPVAISAFFVFTFVAPRLRILEFAGDKTANLYKLLLIALLSATTIVAQNTLRAATAKLTHLSSIADAPASGSGRYFTAKSVCIERTWTRPHLTIKRDAKNNTPEKYVIYLAVPVCRGSADTGTWIGIEYAHDVERTASTNQELQAGARAFLAQAIHEFDRKDMRQYRYFERLGHGSDRNNFLHAIGRHGDARTAVILIPHDEEFHPDPEGALRILLWVAAGSALIWLIAIAIPAALPPEYEDDEGGKVLRSIFIPTRGNYGGPLLVDLNIAVYLAMALSGFGLASFEPGTLLQWGANFGPYDRGFGVYRLITCQFVHAGFFHLVNNMYGLIFAIRLLKPIAQNGRLIFCYLACGLAGSIASMLVHPQIISVGASGAILGLWGILMMLSLLGDTRLEREHRSILYNIGIFTGLTLLAGALHPGIDNAAHLGGLGAGLVFGIVLFLLDRDQRAKLKKILGNRK